MIRNESWACVALGISFCEINAYNVKFLKTCTKDKKLKDYITEITEVFKF